MSKKRFEKKNRSEDCDLDPEADRKKERHTIRKSASATARQGQRQMSTVSRAGEREKNNNRQTARKRSRETDVYRERVSRTREAQWE